MTETDGTQDLAFSPEHRLGAVDHRLQIPALALPAYIRLQRVLLRQPPSTARKRTWASSLIFLIACMVTGGIVGVLTSALDLSATLWVGIDDTDAGWVFEGREVVLLAFLLMVVTAVCGALQLQRHHRRMLRNVHAAGGELFGAHELVIGEGGLFLHNVARSQFVPWTAVTRVVDDEDGIFIVADHISAFWVPESVLSALPDRAAFMACLDRRAAHR